MFGKKLKSKIGKLKSSVTSALPFWKEDTYRGPEGEIFIEMTDVESGEVLEERHEKNVITKDFSILLARLCKNSLDPNHGVFALAVGTGESSWDPMNPPASTETQRSLYDEIERKSFSEIVYRDDGGSTSSTPTDTVDFTTVFAQSEAVGPLVEMGLLGGDVHDDLTTTNSITPANGPYDENVDVTGKDILCNYLTFPVINKPSTAELSITWRISF
jgi:hypothetical protein